MPRDLWGKAGVLTPGDWASIGAIMKYISPGQCPMVGVDWQEAMAAQCTPPIHDGCCPSHLQSPILSSWIVQELTLFKSRTRDALASHLGHILISMLISWSNSPRATQQH